MAPNVGHPTVSRVIERAYLRSLSGIITVCNSTRDDIASLTIGAVPTIVARAGRDHLVCEMRDAEIDARAHESGPLRVLFVGTVSPHKGLHRLLDALAALPTGTATLDVAGSLTQSPAYVRSIRARVGATAGNTVTLHGEVDQIVLQALYRRAQVFALPSDREAYPLAALDALGFGLPALLPRSGGSSEMIRDGDEGRLLDSVAIAQWTTAIADLARDRDRLSAQGRAARARHAAHSTWADTAAGVHAFLSELCVSA
jgi:glycosyltransferase involved in cell wall biosynthesis